MFKEEPALEMELSQQLKGLQVEEIRPGTKKKRRKKKKTSIEEHKQMNEQSSEAQARRIDQLPGVETIAKVCRHEELKQKRTEESGGDTKEKHNTAQISNDELSSTGVTKDNNLEKIGKENEVPKSDPLKSNQHHSSGENENHQLEPQSRNNNRKNNKNNRDRDFFVECPHCQGLVQVLAIKCGIFRHGVFKSTGRQLKPHETKERCESFVARGVVEGCGKPFMISKTDRSVSVCDYL
jgi:hypothetical protein